MHFSADDQLICLHDLSVDRTSTSHGPAYERTLAELQTLDFGSWKVRRPRADQRTLITLAELLELTADARARGVDVSLAIETKHPNPRGHGGRGRRGRPARAVRLDSAREPGADHLLLPARVWTEPRRCCRTCRAPCCIEHRPRASGATVTCRTASARSARTTCCCARIPATSTGCWPTVTRSTSGRSTQARDVTWCLSLGVSRNHHRRSCRRRGAVARWEGRRAAYRLRFSRESRPRRLRHPGQGRGGADRRRP